MLGSNKISLYKKSIDLLSKIQKITQKKIKNFNGKNYKIPIYTKNKLFKEAKLFSEWYAKKYISKKKLPIFNIEINKQIKFLLSNLKLKNDTLVHRDFHVSNLMKYKKKIAIIDTQDALIGNRAYDLASLIDDVRFKLNKKLKDNIYNYYLKLNKNKIDRAILLNDFEILSVLRSMKIIGIFTRLSSRDKKVRYLKLIPHAWQLIELRIKNNDIFDNLNEEDVWQYRYPSDTEIDELGVRGIYLGNYIRWDPKAQHEEMIKKYPKLKDLDEFFNKVVQISAIDKDVFIKEFLTIVDST